MTEEKSDSEGAPSVSDTAVVPPITVTFDASDHGERLDVVLARRGLGASRSELQRWIGAGRVKVAGRVVVPSRTVRAGEEAVLWPLPPLTSDAKAEAIPLPIVYIDDDLVVVDKPAGMVVHPAPGHPGGTLVNAMLHHAPTYPAAADGDDRLRPGIVHRLDKDTTGLMVVARSARAKQALVAAFQTRSIKREYLAIAHGRVAALTLAAPIARHPRDRKRFSSTTGIGKAAVTHVAPVESLHFSTLISCRLETGRTHQIRVHLTDVGHPLVGDPVYRRRDGHPEVQAVGNALGRQALHAASLAFEHPRTGSALSFSSPLPRDFAEALEALRR